MIRFTRQRWVVCKDSTIDISIVNWKKSWCSCFQNTHAYITKKECMKKIEREGRMTIEWLFEWMNEWISEHWVRERQNKRLWKKRMRMNQNRTNKQRRSIRSKKRTIIFKKKKTCSSHCSVNHREIRIRRHAATS